MLGVAKQKPTSRCPAVSSSQPVRACSRMVGRWLASSPTINLCNDEWQRRRWAGVAALFLGYLYG